MLSADTMALVLRDVAVKENRGLLGSIVLGKPEDVQFLAPLLVEGLTRAASNQKVGFHVVQTGMPLTKGTLYAYGRSLYLTMPWLISLSRYGAGGQALPPTIFFFPESAKRPDSCRNARADESTLGHRRCCTRFTPIDSEIPASVQIPTDGPAVVTGHTPAPAQTIQPIRAPISRKTVNSMT